MDDRMMPVSPKNNLRFCVMLLNTVGREGLSLTEPAYQETELEIQCAKKAMFLFDILYFS